MKLCKLRITTNAILTKVFKTFFVNILHNSNLENSNLYFVARIFFHNQCCNGTLHAKSKLKKWYNYCTFVYKII